MRTSGGAEPFRHPVVRADEVRPSLGHEGYDGIQPEPHSTPVGRAGAYRQGECVPGGGMLGRILFENVYSSLKISPTVG